MGTGIYPQDVRIDILPFSHILGKGMCYSKKCNTFCDILSF